jgi:3-oxoacyl-[acyl-carrier protein] reductase
MSEQNRKVALVIGGTGALGSETCRRLATKGFSVAFTWHSNQAKAETLAEELSANAYQLDLRDPDKLQMTIREIAESLGSIDAFVVVSGIATAYRVDGEPVVPKFFELTPSAYDEMMSVNVRGTVFACQEVGRIMATQGGGRIVIVSSIDGVKPMPAPVDYACCKAALWGLTQSMSKELGKLGILVNMLAPGILEGGIADLLSDELMEEYKKHCTLRRVGTFREAADMLCYLVGEKNTYLTGQAVVLDGGL